MNRSNVIQFLECYEKYSCLWDPVEKDYRNNEVRKAAYKAIIQEMGINMTLNELRLKIKSIRTTYKRELRKIEESLNNGDSDVYTPQLIWFPIADRFLNSVGEEESSTNKMYKLRSQPKYITTSSVKKKKEIIPSRPLVFKSEPVLETDSRDGRHDEFDVFGQHVANHLRNLPLENAITCQNFINNYLSKERLFVLKQSQTPSSLLSINSLYDRNPSSPGSTTSY